MSVLAREVNAPVEPRNAPVVIVSCDTHIGPRLVEDLRPYCPSTLLAEFDAYVVTLRDRKAAAGARKERIAFGGKTMGPDWTVLQANLATRGHHDMHARLRDLDNDGVAAEVLFHDRQNGELIPFQTETLLMRGSAHLQPLAGRRVLDRARAHIGLMHLPMWDIDAAGRELEWARSIGLRGLNFASPSPTSSPITTRSGTLSSQPARI